jgi:tetratricopeptide (TPR) repeat protein
MIRFQAIPAVRCIACAVTVVTGISAGCTTGDRATDPVVTPMPAAETPSAAVSETPSTRNAGASTPAAAGAWRAGMIDDAWSVASSPETRAHERIKSRLQREVAATAIELGMVDTALRHAEAIKDWRRAEVMALAAQALARSGEPDRATALLQGALEGSAGTEGWMREQLLTEIAIGLAALGDVDQARQFAGQVPQERTGRVEAELVSGTSLEDLDRQCDAFDAAIATKAFDVVRSGVEGYLAVWKRVPGDGVRVARAEKAIRDAAPGLPIDLQIELRVRMADRLAAVGRRDDAAAELAQACEQFRNYDFTPDTVGVIARDLARGLLRQGQPGQARRVIQDTLARYRSDTSEVVDIDRADVLRPLAEAMVDAGDRDEALRIWRLALEAGALNPNARPRAEDLCLTCLSMVRSGVEPPADMRATIRSIRSGLKAPW